MKVSVGALLLAAAITNVAYTLLIPFVPLLERDFEMTSFAIGASFGGFALTKALFQPLGGLFSDRWGARRVAFGGLIATALATFGLSLASTGEQIILWRLAWGVAEGATVPALYQLCFTVRAGDTDYGGKVMGWYGAAAVLGMAAGPAIVGLLHDDVSFGTFFQLTAGLTVLAALLVFATRPMAVANPVARTNAESVPDGTLATSLVGTVLVLGAADFLNNFLFGALEPTLPLYVAKELDGSTEAISATFTLGLLVFAACSALAGNVVGRLGLPGTIAAAFAIATAGLVLQAAAGTVTTLAAAFMLFMTSQPLVYVAARRGIAAVERARQGRAFGYLGLISDFGYVLGPVAGTALLVTSPTLLFAALAAASLAAAALALVAALTSIDPHPSLRRLTGKRAKGAAG